MKTAVIALTKKGTQLATIVGEGLDADVYVKKEFLGLSTTNRTYGFEGNFGEFTGKLLSQYTGLVFIMACGIVVRSIAPFLKDKKQDPAMVVLDEKGTYVISLLSGHLGGANALAREIATITGGEAVITTSTDVNNVIAFDEFAKINDFYIENLENLKYISGELVNGGRVSLLSDIDIDGIYSDPIVKYSPENPCSKAVVISNKTDIDVKADKVLILRPRNLILGIGCKMGTSLEAIESAVMDFMKSNGLSMASLQCVATVDLKENEAGIAGFALKYGLELRIIPREAIRRVEPEFEGSDFVRTAIGVGAVAEPCAVLAGTDTQLIIKKAVYRGITLALAREERKFSL